MGYGFVGMGIQPIVGTLTIAVMRTYNSLGTGVHRGRQSRVMVLTITVLRMLLIALGGLLTFGAGSGRHLSFWMGTFGSDFVAT